MTISQLRFLVIWVCNQRSNNSEEGWFAADYDFHRPHDIITAWYTWERRRLCFKPKEIYGVINCHFHRKEKLSVAAVLFKLNMMKTFAEEH